MSLSLRQKNILSAVIREYINSANPVGSKELIEKYKLNLSAATIRNEMAVLEKMGYIFQPHTSAGRVPTDLGYKYFIEALMPKRKMSEKEQKDLQVEFLKLKAKHRCLSRVVSKLLSETSNNLALTGFANEEVLEAGMPKLLSQPEFSNLPEIQQLTKCLEKFEENPKKASKKLSGKELNVYIGKNNPLMKLDNCATIVSSFKTKDNKKGFIMLIGPKRMKYAKNISLLKYITKLLSGAFAIVMLVRFI